MNILNQGEQLKEKSNEISKLRSEIMANEQMEYSLCKDDTNLQRRYQSEIKNLEEYTSQLQNELEGLRNEKEDLIEKVLLLFYYLIFVTMYGTGLNLFPFIIL